MESDGELQLPWSGPQVTGEVINLKEGDGSRTCLVG